MLYLHTSCRSLLGFTDKMNDHLTIHELEKQPLSDGDIQRLVKTTVVRYPDLKKHSLDDLLKTGSCVILFLTKNSHDGHWTCLIDHGSYLEFFCSFGTQPDGHFRWLSPARGRKLDGPPVLGPMLRASKKPVVYNTFQFQNKAKADCGRHVVARIMHKDIDLDSYKALMGNENPDDWVTEETNK